MKTNRTKEFCGLLALLALTACSSNQNEGTSDSHLWHVTLNASMGDATRALSEGDNNVLTASFEANDKVEVVAADGNTIGTLTAQTAGPSTTLEGTLDATTLTAGEEVKLHYRSATANYDGQNGTLSGIASKQDYAVGTLTVKTTDPLTFESNSVTLAAQQSITKFSFKEDGINDVSVHTFGIAAAGLVQRITAKDEETVGAVTGTLPGTLPTPSTEVYVALRNNSNILQTYSFYIQDNSGNWYTGTKRANLANGSNYAATVALTKLNNLTASSEVGTIGVLDGRPAIVANIKSEKKAVALMNDGALCPEAYGTYHAFDDTWTESTSGWYVPTETDLDGLDDNTYAWRTQNGVDGCLFTIATGKTLFLPAAGFYDNEHNPDVLSDGGTGGFYWSSTKLNQDKKFAAILHFDNSGIDNYTTIDYMQDKLSVRRFHALPK